MFFPFITNEQSSSFFACFFQLVNSLFAMFVVSFAWLTEIFVENRHSSYILMNDSTNFLLG